MHSKGWFNSLPGKIKIITKVGDFRRNRGLGSGLLSFRDGRTGMSRYTRRSNGFSRKLANHAAATALNYFVCNLIKIDRTLRMSPAMAAGVTDRLWSVENLVALWGSYEQRRAERAA